MYKPQALRRSRKQQTPFAALWRWRVICDSLWHVVWCTYLICKPKHTHTGSCTLCATPPNECATKHNEMSLILNDICAQHNCRVTSPACVVTTTISRCCLKNAMFNSPSIVVVGLSAVSIAWLQFARSTQSWPLSFIRVQAFAIYKSAGVCNQKPQESNTTCTCTCV